MGTSCGCFSKKIKKYTIFIKKILALYKVLCYNILCRELLPPSDPIHIKPKSIGVPVLFSYTKKEL